MAHDLPAPPLPIRIGFGDLSVTMDVFEDVTIKEGPHAGETVKNVPTDVEVAKKVP